MIMPDFKDFPRRGRIIAFDWGARRTGVAISDESREFVFARPPICVGRGADITPKILECIADEHVVGIVFGLPLRTNGAESDTTRMVRGAVDKIAGLTNLPICFIDETLTSATAADEMDIHDEKSSKEKLDSESARLILENAIAVIKRL